MNDSEIREKIDTILEKYTSPKNVENEHGNIYYDFSFIEAKNALMSLFTEGTVKAQDAIVDRIVEMADTKVFGKWTQKDIATFFEQLGRFTREYTSLSEQKENK